MDYEKFKNTLLQKLQEAEGKEAEIQLRKIEVNNGPCYDGVAISEKGEQFVPLVSLEPYYRLYLGGETMDRLVSWIIEERRRRPSEENLPPDAFTNFEELRDRIFFRLVNYDRNAAFLKKVPYIRKLDLAAVFYHCHQFTDFSGTVTVANEDLEKWKLTVQELWDLAAKNTPRCNPPVFCRMSDLLGESLMPTGQDRDGPPMIVLTNEEKNFGAACMLYENVFSDLADEINTSLYILPSSVHEIILLPDSGDFSKQELEEMVTEINENEVAPSEVLSNHVYKYDRDLCKIVM